MKGVLGHLRAHVGQTWSGEPPEDGEMNEMTLSCGHKLRNSIPGGLRAITKAPYNIEYLRVSGEEANVLLKPECHFPSRQQ